MPGCRAGPRRRVVSPSGGSILMTSAPRSPRVCAAQAPSTTVVTSRTRMPTSGPRMSRHAPGACPPAIDRHRHATRGDGAHAIGEIRGVGVERRERTELADRLELVGPPVDRDDRAAELPGYLDHVDADAAGRAHDQHSVAGSDRGPSTDMERRRDRVGNRRGVNDRDALGHRKEIPRREREVFGVAAIRGHADLPAQAAAEQLLREAAEITARPKEILPPPASAGGSAIDPREPPPPTPRTPRGGPATPTRGAA